MPKIVFMNDFQQIVLIFSFIISTLMGLVSYELFKMRRQKQFFHQTEFWASFGVNAIIAIVILRSQTNIAAISMLTWPWTLRTFKIMMEDFLGNKITNHWHPIIVIGAGIISFVLAGYGLRFFYITVPFSFVTGGLGLFILYRFVKETSGKMISPLIKMCCVLFGVYFLKRFLFPITRLNSNMTYLDILIESLFLVSLAGIGLAAYFEILKQKSDDYNSKLLEDRSKKFIGQSKFSELGMMSAGIAHEINNPLAVIQARTSQLLRICKEPTKQKEICEGLQQILSTSERINKTIQGVREFVHQDENSPLVEIELKELFDNVLSFCGQRMKNHGVNLRFYGLENLFVIGHKVQLEQLILNLLNNSFDAIEFLPDKWIEVNCLETIDKIEIYFKDSGKGIPHEIASQMMEPFFTTKEIGRGTGLGLSLARGIAELHGGNLRYLSDRQHTTFVLELPKVIHKEMALPFH